MPGRYILYFAHVQDDVNPHILRMLERTFSLEAAQVNMRRSINGARVVLYFGQSFRVFSANSGYGYCMDFSGSLLFRGM